MKNITMVMFFLIIITPLSGTILSRSTIENWEGSLEEAGWVRNTDGDGEVFKGAENGDPDSYQTQAHGKWSLWLYDPDNSSYANAYKSFDNDSSEYMVEFYIWIKDDHPPIDSFPLCELLYDDTQGDTLKGTHKSDVSLYLNKSHTRPGFDINIEDSVGMHYEAGYIDSTNRWYKIQLYRYPSGDSALVDFYLDGDFIDSYSPMTSEHVTNQISLGTTSDNPEADGEVFYDDVIICDYHIDYADLKTQITQIEHMLSLVSKPDSNPYFTRDDINNFRNLVTFLNNNFNKLSNYEKISYFNTLIVMFDQIRLALLDSNFNVVESRH